MKHTKGTTILVLLLQIGFSQTAANTYLSSYNDTADHQPIVKSIPKPNNLQLTSGDTVLIDALGMSAMKPTASLAAASTEQLRSLDDKNAFLKSVSSAIDDLEKEKINLVKDNIFKNSNNVHEKHDSSDRITQTMFENEVKYLKEAWERRGTIGDMRVVPLENTRTKNANFYQPSVSETDATYTGGNSKSMSEYDNNATTSSNASKSANRVKTSGKVSKSVNAVKTPDNEYKTAETSKAMDTSNLPLISKRTVDADSSCQLDVVETALTFSESIETAGGVVELVCRGDVMVNKCEGMCNSNVWPSVNHYDGYQKECSCCRDAGARQRDITLSSCTIGSAAVTGHYLTRTIVEPASCSCMQCRS